ncbi:MAG: NAD-dependent deacylase [Acidobacteria bacterium]|nr:NAD-dependent deacylase [Acidobacteriota bacterium]
MSSETIERVRDWLRSAKRIVVLTGAGISTESGLQDFRGPQGLWTKDPDAEKLSDIRYYMSDAAIRRKAWLQRLEMLARMAVPNRGHLALVQLERRGTLHALITQNIDGLHQEAGTSPDLLVEVHGTVRRVRCMQCAWKGPMEETLARVQAGEADPPCLECGGILKSDTISFGQPLVPAVISRAMRAAETADLLLAVGTSLQVYPVAGAVPVAHDAGAHIVILNGEPTPFDELADAVLGGSIGDVLPRLL